MVAAAQAHPSSLFLRCPRIQKSRIFTQIKHRLITAAKIPSSILQMDPGCSFQLLLSCPSALPKSLVRVDFSPRFDRIPHSDPSLEDSITQVWNRRIEENPSLYNGIKFRYGGNSLHHVEGSEEDSSICLHLGLTDYRTFVGTNLNPLWKNFLVPSEDDSVRCQHTSSPLGNGAVVETSDKKIIVLQRSHNVGEFPGYFVFPGGHSEPQEIGISSHQTGNDSTESTLLNQKISEEMFEGIVREVVEETGVPAESLGEPLFIGVSRRDQNVRPTAFFYVKCNLDSKEVFQLYSRAQDGYESTHLHTVSKDEVEKMALKMPGCHRGGYALYMLMVEATNCASLCS